MALLGFGLSLPLPAQQGLPVDAELEQFKLAWQAANKGDRSVFAQIKDDLGGYLLYPYLQYEDFRYRRATVASADMASFLETHTDWAFADGLRTAWLRALGETEQWDDLLLYAPGEQDIEVQCYLAQAMMVRGDAGQLLPLAQALWAVGQSQPDACDPVFLWLRKADGITPSLAWLRISRAMEARNPGLTVYLAGFVPLEERVWVERWQTQDRQGYSRLDLAGQWPDEDKARHITEFGLKRLARSDSNKAWQLFTLLDGKIHWDADQQLGIRKEIAFWSAVENVPDSLTRLNSVPREARDDKLLEWWARNGLANENWVEVITAITTMSDELKKSDRWRYWDARARLKMLDPGYATELLTELSLDASYYGFLAADYLNRPYSICPGEPSVSTEELALFRNRPEIRRLLLLDAAGLKNWSRREWNLALNRMSRQELQLAAALAIEQSWPDRAILALGKSDDRNWYEWRFPLTFNSLVMEQAGKQNLDASWVYGLMRAESAMAEDAISPANARGLMQVLPGTAAELARRHGQPYHGSEQLLQADANIVFGTTFMRELMDRFDDNPVLVSGAYNAGPQAVSRWMDALPSQDTAIWVEILPYHETRDYIPRVLAFSTIYNWRLQQPVRRISSRMPALNPGSMGAGTAATAVAEVVCQDLK